MIVTFKKKWGRGLATETGQISRLEWYDPCLPQGISAIGVP